MDNFAHLIYGYEKKVETCRGKKRYINFDNAASTPPFKSVMQTITEAAAWYSSVHRGAGFKSKYSTERYESARRIIAQFIGADLERDVVIFTKNTTDSINKLSHYLPWLPGEMIIFTKVEHHSNELPWQNHNHYCVPLKNNGLDLENLEEVLRKNAGKVKLVAVSGASNVSGYLPPIYSIAEMAHAYGAKILVDGAQLIPHRPIVNPPWDDPRHLDFIAFSGHKIYAPFGSGVLIGPRSLFDKGCPSQVGGGTVKGIGPQGIIWNPPPENEEAGSPNVLGAIAIAEACQTITAIGWPALIAHEKRLIRYALKQLAQIPELTVYNAQDQERVGVISFNIQDRYHRDVAEYLSAHYGIGVRSGCFCARRYVAELLSLDYREINLEKPPGMVRMSFGCYNSPEEIDIAVEGLHELVDTIKKSRIKRHIS